MAVSTPYPETGAAWCCAWSIAGNMTSIFTANGAFFPLFRPIILNPAGPWSVMVREQNRLIQQNQILSDAEQEKTGSSEHPRRARQIVSTATRLLARREYGVDELRERLGSKGFPPDLVESTIIHLVEIGAVSDERFADQWLDIHRRRGRGPNWIAATLRDRGIDPEVIGSIIDPYHPEWYEAMRAIWQKRGGSNSPTAIDRQRLRRYLIGRGYTPMQIDRLFSAGLDGEL